MDEVMVEVLFWTVLLLVLVVTEALTMGLTTIWFAIGALTALIAAACHVPLFLQITLFLVVSVVMLVFTRPVAKRYFNNGRTRTNVNSLLGQKGIVTEEIDNLKGCGQVTLNGMEWTARSVGKEKILQGCVVIVKRIDGVKLIVEMEG